MPHSLLPRPLRVLARRPGWTAGVVLVLALGSGVAGAVGAVAHTALVRPLPYRDSDRLVAVFTSERQGTEPRNPSAPADFLDWQRRCRTLEHLTAARPKTFTLTGGGAAREVPALMATPELFALLGVEAAIGRTFGPADAEARQIVLSAGLWRRELGGDPAVVGRALRLDGEPYTVVGVMPEGFHFPPFWATDAEAWVPLVFTPEQAADREAAFLRVFGRLAAGATVEGAAAEVAAVTTALRRAGAGPAERATTVEPLREPTVAAVRPTLRLLLAGAGLLLLVTVASAANLLLARALERRPEAALRAALGASRRRLVGEAFGESAALAAAGGALGLLLSRLLVAGVSRRFPGFLPPVTRLDLDGVAVALPLATAGGAALLAALAAVAGGRGGTSVARAGRGVTAAGAGARRLLVAAQVAFAVVLLSGAATTADGLWRLRHTELGFAVEDALAVDLSLAASPAAATAASQERFFSRLAGEVGRLPGVRAVGVVNHLPLRGDFWRNAVAVEGRPAPPAAVEAPVASFRVVSDGYFRALGTPVVLGRPLRDDRADGEPVAVVNAAFARQWFGGAAAVGGRLRLGGDAEPWLRIVGVVADARQTGLAEPAVPEVYLPYSQNPVPWYDRATLVVRHEAGAAPLAAVAAAVRRLDTDVALARPQALAAVLGDEVAPQRLQLLRVGVFAAGALLLALAGLHAMARLFVASRTRELGVRQALGADRAHVRRLVLREGVAVALPGLLVGAAGATLAGRAIATGMPVPGIGEGAMLVAAGAVGALATWVVWLQARRAAAVGPMAALRGDA